MDPWLDDLEGSGFTGTMDDDLMQYLDVHAGVDSMDHDDLEFSEETASIKSETSEHPSPFDFKQPSPWDNDMKIDEQVQDDRANWESSKDFRFDYRRAQMLLQDTVFGRTSGGASTPPPNRENYASLIHNGFEQQNYKYKLHLGELPMRSRVETQIKCTLVFDPPPEEHLLHLPGDTIARPRFQLRDGYVPNPAMLSLEVDAVVPSDPSKPVYMCAKCIAREKKRAFRKKTLDTNEEHHWNETRARRLVILNCREVLLLPLPKRTELTMGETVTARQIDLPLRLACYCRHHAAKSGYQLVFTVRDYKDNVVARTISNNIFITDNHKEPRAGGGSAMSAGGIPPPMLSDVSNSSVASSLDESSDHSTTSRRSVKSGYHPYARRDNSDWNRRSSSISNAGSGAYGTNSVVSSSHPSPGIVGVGPGPGLMGGHPLTGGMPGHNRMLSANSALPQDSGPPAVNVVVQRAIPAQGSIRGGVEVTLLGQGFYPGLVAMFGDSPAISTQCWSDNTMISHLPPSSVAGPVTVSFQGLDAHPQSAVFTYIDDSQVKLVELALQVVGFKMNGKIEDAADVASRIVKEDQSRSASDSQGQGITEGNAEQVTLKCLELVRVAPGQRIANLNLRNTEGQTMMHMACMLGYHRVVVSLMAQGANIDVQDVSGMTPLHFAAMFGNRLITRQLLDGHADPFHRNYGGSTVIDIADSTVTDLLPKDQRNYYQKLNSQNSSSTLASILSRENLVQPLFSDRPSSQLPSPTGGSLEESEGDDDESILATVRRLRQDRKSRGSDDVNHYQDVVKFIFRILGIDKTQKSDHPPEYKDIFPIKGEQEKTKTSALTAVSASGSGQRERSRGIIEIAVSESSDEEQEDEDDDDQTDPTDEQVIEGWESSPMKQIRNDHMLFTFWIPLLVIALSYVASLFWNIGGDASAKINAAGESVNTLFTRFIHLREFGARRRT